MKALTFHQPFGSLVIAGAKKIETRSWPTPSTLAVGDRFAIHAGKHLFYEPGSDFDARVAKYLGPDWPNQLPLGAMLGTAVLQKCIPMGVSNKHVWPEHGSDEREFGLYLLGRWMWYLTDVIPFEQPIPMRGYQRLWTWRTDGVAS